MRRPVTGLSVPHHPVRVDSRRACRCERQHLLDDIVLRLGADRLCRVDTHTDTHQVAVVSEHGSKPADREFVTTAEMHSN